MQSRPRSRFSTFFLTVLVSSSAVFADNVAVSTPNTATAAKPGTDGATVLAPKKKPRLPKAPNRLNLRQMVKTKPFPPIPARPQHKTRKVRLPPNTSAPSVIA